MTYAQELEERGKIKNQVEVIEGLLQESIGWDVIERVTGVNEAQFQVLKQQVEDLRSCCKIINQNFSRYYKNFKVQVSAWPLALKPA